MSLASVKVPAILASSIVSLAVGVALGVGAMSVYGYRWERPPDSPSVSPMAAGGGAPGGMAGGGGGRGGMGGGGGAPGGMMGMGGMGGGGGRGPNPKIQLVSLVAKLDQLTGKPLAVHFSEDQRKKVAEQLKGLADVDDLKEDDAKQRLDSLLELVKDQRETLEAAGYRWPGGRGGFGGGGPGPEAPNPFKEGTNLKHLESLQGHVAKANIG
jgi:hypothetical protein